MEVPVSLALLVCAVLLQTVEGECPGERSTKQLFCYVEHLPEKFDPCLCTHLVLQTPLEKLTSKTELLESARRLQERNPSLRLLLRVTESADVALKKRSGYPGTVATAVSKAGLDGVELALTWGKPTAAKVQLVDFVQTLSKELEKLEPKERSKRSYKIYEDIVGDVVTPRWTPQASHAIKRKTREAESAESKEDAETTAAAEKEATTTDKPEETVAEEEEEEVLSGGKQIVLHLPAEPQHLAKNYDLKRLSKYVSLFTLASDNMTDASEQGLAHHPARLMGIDDILNADSLVDLVTGLGAAHEKLILTLPATAMRFTLADKTKNMPQSPVTGEPTIISRAEVCTLMSKGEWTLERDEDLTAPYAFQDTTWLAFDDPTSVSIKGKYILLRDLAGAAVRDSELEDWTGKCGDQSGALLLQTLHETFTNIARRSRAAQLVSLQEQLHEAGQFSYSGDVHLSPYRIVRVVDRAGSITVVRKEAKTEFECSRQGYFRHPSGCNRFYRCVKFNQYTPDFTVFEYDCPAGLAFDETVEVCVWPGSLADGGACQGSSEIAPVPRSRYVCPSTSGYYADPENCRWFFACLDHQGDGSPPTAYEFRCPFGLVFDEQALVCNWPWLVPGCGGTGLYTARFTVGDFYEGRHRPSYASLSDVHVSGGRIENVPGGVVLGSAVSGVGSGAYLGSGAGAYPGAAGSYGGYSGLGAGNGAYLAGGSGFVAGDLASGSQQTNTVSGSGADYASEGAGGSGYSSGAGAYNAGLESGAYNAAAGGAGSTYSAGSGAYNAGSAGSGAYNAAAGGAGSAYSTGSGAYNAGSAGSGAYNAAAGGAGSAYSTGSGAYNAGSSGSGTYNAAAGGAGSAYSTGSGAYNAGSAGSGAYNAAAGGAGSGAYNAAAGGAGSAYSTGSGAYSAGSAGSGAYNAAAGGAGSAYSTGSGAYNAGSSGSGVYNAGIAYSAGSGKYSSGTLGGSGAYSTGNKYGGAGSFGSYGSGAYAAGTGSYEDNSGAYVEDNSGAYIHDSTGDTGGLYSGMASYGGQYSGGYENGGAYVHQGSSGGQYSGSYDTGAYKGEGSTGGQYKGEYDAGSYSGKYDAGSYAGKYDAGSYAGKYDAGSYAGKYDAGAYAGKYDGGAYAGKYDGGDYSGKYDGGAYSGKYDSGAYAGSGKYEGGAYSGKYDSGAYSGSSDSDDYRGGNYQGAVAYQGGYGYKAPATVVTGGSHSYNSLGIEHKPAVALVGLDAVRVSGGDHSGGYVSSYVTPSAIPVSPVVSGYSTVTPAPVSISTFKASTVQPTTPRPVTYYPVSSTVTPVQPVVSYSTVRPPVVQTYQQPSYVKTVTPAPVYSYSTPSPSPVTYTYKQPLVKNEYVSTGYQYSTPEPAPVEVKYSYPQPTVFKTPIVPLNPIQYSTPAPVFSYSTPAPPTYEVNEVPLRPVQYSTPSPVHFEYSTPSSVSYQTPKPLRPVTYSTPAPAVYEYSTPKPLQPLRPLKPITYSTPAPVSFEYNVPTVLKTPVVPLNPVQYSTPAPVHFEYSSPSPKPLRPVGYSTPAPVSYQYLPPAPVQPVRPVTYSTPAPAVTYEYQSKPVVPAVYKTPVVPLNPIQYTTPAPVQFEYSTPAPYKPVSYSTPAPSVSYEYRPVKPVQPVRPVTYSTPAPSVSYEYLPPAPTPKPYRPVTYSTPAPPAPSVTYYSSPAVKPVVPVVYKEPEVPYNPVQYTTPAPIHFEYSTPAPVPVKPLQPISYSTPAPKVSYEYQPPAPVRPLRPNYSTPAPAVYQYNVKPVVPAVLRTPVVPLNPVQYTTPAPVHFDYSTPAPRPLRPISYSTPAPAVNYQYLPPAPAPVQQVKPLRPVVYSTPAPSVSYEYSPRPVVPTVYKTPVVPLNPVQYTTPAPVHFEYSTPAPLPVKPITYTTPAPAVNYAYVPPAPVRPLKPITLSSPAPFSYDYKYNYQSPVVPTVLKTPVVPLNPVQYTTPAPTVYQYSTPSVSYKPVTYSTPAPAVYSTTVAPATFEYKTTSYVKPVPSVLKTPVVPLNPIQYSTPSPAIVNQYSFGSAYQNSQSQYQSGGYVKTQVVEEGYDYPKPSVKFEESPRIVSTTSAPPVTYSVTPEPVYQQVYNYIKAPMVSAYDKVVSAISYSTTPAPLPVQPVTQSPVSYAPVNVGPSYRRPVLVKTPSIPVTPVAVVPEYQKVLNVVKASTTPAPLYVNHYTNSYEEEVIPVSTPKPVVYKQQPLVQTYVKDYSYEDNAQDLYEAVKSDFGTRLSGGYEGGYVYNQQKVEVPQVQYTSTTPAPAPVTYKVRKPVETYLPAAGVGYEQGSYYSSTPSPAPVTYKVRKPVKTYLPAAGVGYEQGSYYSSTPAPAVVSSSEASFGAGEQYHKETSFSGYSGYEGDAVHYEEVAQGLPVVTSTVNAPTVKVTTARVSLPVVPARPDGGYYVRKQKVRVRPTVSTESYPSEVYSSTYTPSTVSTTTFAPTYSYSTSPAPAVTFSTTGHPEDEVDVEDEVEEDGVKLLEGYNQQFGGYAVSKGGYSASSTVSSIEDGEAIVGVLKKGRITYDGRRTKTKVVVVSKLSDFNPLLVGKLGAECSCNGQSNTLTVRKQYRQRGQLFTPSRDSTIPDQQYVDSYLTSTSTLAPLVVDNSPVVEIKPIRKKTRYYSSTSTTAEPEEEEQDVYSQVAESPSPNLVPTYGAGTRVKVDSVQCKRAGLFRHPNKCNKFYSCNWDQWKKKFTLHEFKCPIHLAYDVNLGACNWPSKGPACAEDSLLV